MDQTFPTRPGACRRPGSPRVERAPDRLIGHNGPVGTQGKRAGSRRAPKKARSFQPSLLGLAVGVTVAVIAWGYLVYAAIEFGASARAGESQAWVFLAVASLGAVACLFIGLMLIARLLRRLGLASDSSHHSSSHHSPNGTQELPAVPAREPEPSRPVGGRRAAR